MINPPSAPARQSLTAAVALSIAALSMAAVVAPAAAAIIPIELTPTDVPSGSTSVFTVLPTDNPGLFGLDGPDVRFVDFDFDPNNTPIASGTFITTQYSSLGVTMNGIQVSNSVYQGAASAPNATTSPVGQVDLIFTFSVPVVAFGAINTSPDADVLEFWSGPNGTGTMLFSFADQGGTTSPNFFVDRFIGGFITGGTPIGSVVYQNNTGNIELDEFIFEVELDFFETRDAPEPATWSLLGLALLGTGLLRRRRLAPA